MSAHWRFLGEGTYNRAYVNSAETQVLKVCKHKHLNAVFDTPERSVRVWNELNPEYPASKTMFEGRPAWVCPFIEGRQATDDEIVAKLIDIFKRTGRIVVDAPGVRNFLTTDSGKVVCVDIGYALQLYEKCDGSPLNRRRIKSETSVREWPTVDPTAWDAYFNEMSAVFPKAVLLIKALLVIKTHCPDEDEVAFLAEDEVSCRNLAANYHCDSCDSIEIQDLITTAQATHREKIQACQRAALARCVPISHPVVGDVAPLSQVNAKRGSSASVALTVGAGVCLSLGAMAGLAVLVGASLFLAGVSFGLAPVAFAVGAAVVLGLAGGATGLGGGLGFFAQRANAHAKACQSSVLAAPI